MNSSHMMTGASAGIFFIFLPSVSIYPAFIGRDSASLMRAMTMLTAQVFWRMASIL